MKGDRVMLDKTANIRDKEEVRRFMVESIELAKKVLIETGVCKSFDEDLLGADKIAVTNIAIKMYDGVSW